MDPLKIAGALAVIAAGVAGLVYLIVGGYRLSHAIHRLVDGLLGDRALGRPGVVERLDDIDGRLDGFDARLGAVEAQVHPNGGRSLHDKIDRALARERGAP